MKTFILFLAFGALTTSSSWANRNVPLPGQADDGCAMVKVTSISEDKGIVVGACYCTTSNATNNLLATQRLTCNYYCALSVSTIPHSCVAITKKPAASSTSSASRRASPGKKSVGTPGGGTAANANQSSLVVDKDGKVTATGEAATEYAKKLAQQEAVQPEAPKVDQNKLVPGEKNNTIVQSTPTPTPIPDSGSNYVANYNDGINSDQTRLNYDIASQQKVLGKTNAVDQTAPSHIGANGEYVEIPAKDTTKPEAVVNYSDADKKLAKQRLKDDEKKLSQVNSENEILNKNNGTYGGNYGGAKVETTQTINMGVKTLSTIASQVATNSASSQNNNVMYGIQQQGAAATQKAMNNSQADMLENSAKANNTLGIGTVIMSAIQGERINEHLKSKTKVTNSYSQATQRANTALAAARERYNSNTINCSNPAWAAQCKTEADRWQKAQDLYASQMDNADKNKRAEIDAQKSAAGTQTIETATTAAQAAMMMKQAASLKEAANALRNQAVADDATGFSFNPGAVGDQPTPETVASTADTGAVVGDDVVAPGAAGNTDLLNPNIPEAGPGGPAAGAFTNTPPGAGAGGSPLAGGSVGGTSAAKDDAKPETSALTKSAVGTYSAGEGTGSKFSRMGGMGGTAVGLDSGGLGDLLKKFLPGGEEDKKKDDNLAFDSERSPASDQAAVLGRNQNIFEAIHKRYQKKHTEGAIVFSGSDQG